MTKAPQQTPRQLTARAPGWKDAQSNHRRQPRTRRREPRSQRPGCIGAPPSRPARPGPARLRTYAGTRHPRAGNAEERWTPSGSPHPGTCSPSAASRAAPTLAPHLAAAAAAAAAPCAQQQPPGRPRHRAPPIGRHRGPARRNPIGRRAAAAQGQAGEGGATAAAPARPLAGGVE